MSQPNFPSNHRTPSHTHKSSSDLSSISKKLVNDIIDRQQNYSENSNSNNLSINLENHSISLTPKRQITQNLTTPIENDSDLHLDEKFPVFLTKHSKDFDKIPSKDIGDGVIEEKSESFDSDSGGVSQNSQSKECFKAKQSLHSYKIESGGGFENQTNSNSKSRKSNLVSFGATRGFNNEDFHDSRRNVDLMIKEEEEKEMGESQNQKLIDKPDTYNIELDTNKSLVRNWKNAKDEKEENKPIIQKTLYGVISNFYLAKKFISLLRNSTIYRRPKWLKSNHFRMINDWSFWENGWDLQRDEEGEIQSKWILKVKMKKIYRNFKEQLVKIKPILMNFIPHTYDPTNNFRVLWDILHLLIIVLNLILSPIEVSFQLTDSVFDSTLLIVFIHISIIFFIFDALVNMNTAYYNRGNLIFSRSMIIRNYLKGPMLRDLLSFCFQFLRIYHPDPVLHYLTLLILLRIYNLKKIFLSIEEFIFVDDQMHNSLALLKLIFGIFFLSHLLACVWHFVGYIQAENEHTWLVNYGIDHSPWYIRYLYSYYYVVISMNTVGYGDIVPQTPFERLYSIFFIYFACWMFAYTINSIGIILQDINKMNRDFIRNINLINGYMRQKNINFDLRIRIRKYIQFIWQEEKAHDDIETSRVIGKLSKSLKQELLLQANGIILRELPMFHLNFSEETLKKIVYTMKEVSFIPGDTIYFANDIDDKSLYILRSGEIELFVETPRFNDPITIIKTLTKKGEVFGEYSFFSDKERETCAKSTTFTSVFIIRQQDVLDIIKESPQDYESFCQIKDQINLYQRYESLYQQCIVCKENEHLSLECPLLHLVLSKARIIQKYNYSENHKRKNGFIRKRIKLFNALKNFEKHENLAQKLHQNIIQSEEEDDDETSEDVSRDSIDVDFTKVSDENPINKEENNTKFKEKPDFISSKGNKTGTKNAATINRIRSNASYESKSSLTLPGIELNETKKPENNQPKFFGDMASPMNKAQLVAFANGLGLPMPKDQISYESLSILSNFSRKLENEAKRKGKLRSKTSDLDEENSMKKIITPRRNNRENSGTADSKSEKKSTNSSKNSFVAGILKKNEEQKETQVFTTTTENKEMNIDDICKSFENYFPHNNVEKILEKYNDLNERKRKKKKLSKNASKIYLVPPNIESYIKTNSVSVTASPMMRTGRRGLMNRTNFFRKHEAESEIETPEIKKHPDRKADRKKSLFDKKKILDFLKEEEKKKEKKMGMWYKMKNTLSFGKKDEELLSKYFIKGSASLRSKKKGK